ncbi:MAG: hypothetical protein JSW65_00095 [Candidatus Bipolaricaulota bacterium]|nr:MAG: hypothetical protein JSW65_00095 [Candidatus Bipolaricaulota bacterium]
MPKGYRATLAVASLLLAIAALGAVAQEAAVGAEELIARADAAFDRWTGTFDFDAYEADLRLAIDLWEEALPLLAEDRIQSRSRVLNSLSQALFELADGYVIDRGDRETLFERGKDAALASLELDPAFVETREADGFRAALLAANDIAAIFWYGNTLGQWLNYHQWTAVMGGVKDVYASFQRSIELDETFDAGGPHRAMGSLLAQAYFTVGRRREDAVAHFERAIEIDPTHLESYVNYAEHYAKAEKDQVLLDELLTTVLTLAEDRAVVAAHPFYNARAIERARRLAR